MNTHDRVKEQIIGILDDVASEVLKAASYSHFDPDSISGKYADKILSLLPKAHYEEVDADKEMPEEHGYYLTNKGKAWADSLTENVWTVRSHSQKYVDVNWWLRKLPPQDEQGDKDGIVSPHWKADPDSFKPAQDEQVSEVCEFVESCHTLTEYVDGKKIDGRFKGYTIPVLEFNELREAAKNWKNRLKQ